MEKMSNLEKIREYISSNPLEVDFIEKLLLNINKQVISNFFDYNTVIYNRRIHIGNNLCFNLFLKKRNTDEEINFRELFTKKDLKTKDSLINKLVNIVLNEGYTISKTKISFSKLDKVRKVDDITDDRTFRLMNQDIDKISGGLLPYIKNDTFTKKRISIDGETEDIEYNVVDFSQNIKDGYLESIDMKFKKGYNDFFVINSKEIKEIELIITNNFDSNVFISGIINRVKSRLNNVNVRNLSDEEKKKEINIILQLEIKNYMNYLIKNILIEANVDTGNLLGFYNFKQKQNISQGEFIDVILKELKDKIKIIARTLTFNTFSFNIDYRYNTKNHHIVEHSNYLWNFLSDELDIEFINYISILKDYLNNHLDNLLSLNN